MGFITTVESVQVGVPRVIQLRGGPRSSGIDKREVPSIMIRREGVAGDHIAADYLGATGQAAYVYSREDHEFFERGLGVSLTAGVFGENITVGRIPLSPGWAIVSSSTKALPWK
jgi:MOSC domain-containing protein YiiM